MEKKMNAIVNKFASVLSSAALSAAVNNSNSTCWFTAYQPVEPKALAKFKKQ